MPSGVRQLGAAIALAALVLACRAAAGGDIGPLLVLAPEGSEEHHETLRAAMAAHLSGYAVEVGLAAIGPLPETFPAQAEAARLAVAEQGALGAIWVDDRHGMVFVLVAAPEGDQILQRPLPDADEPWRARCDAVASMVHSALAPWLDRDEAVEPMPAPEPAAGPEPERPEPAQAGDEERPFADRPPEEPPKRATDWLLLQLRAGYGPVIVNSAGSTQHGGRVGVGLVLGDHLEIEAALDLLFPLAAEIVGGQGEDYTLVRFPLRIAAGGFVTALGLDIGLKAGLVIDFTHVHVRGEDTQNLEEETARTNPGFAGSLYLRYRILDWLAVWVEGGIDAYNSAYDYTLDDVTVIRYSALHGRVSGGVAVLLTLI